MSGPSIKIDLADPLVGHSGPQSVVTLREPTAGDYFDLGEPAVVARNADGTLYTVENDAAIRAYIQRCIVDADPLVLEGSSLRNGLLVKAAVLNFFSAARSKST